MLYRYRSRMYMKKTRKCSDCSVKISSIVTDYLDRFLNSNNGPHLVILAGFIEGFEFFFQFGRRYALIFITYLIYHGRYAIYKQQLIENFNITMSTYTQTDKNGLKVTPTVSEDITHVVLKFTASDNSVVAHFLTESGPNRNGNLSNREVFKKNLNRSSTGIWQLENDQELSSFDTGTYENTTAVIGDGNIELVSFIVNGTGTCRAFLFDNTDTRIDPSIDITAPLGLHPKSDTNESIIT